MKVKDLAKELKESPKDFLRFLRENTNLRITSMTAKLDRSTSDTVRRIYRKVQDESKNVFEVGEEVLVELEEAPKTLGELIEKTGSTLSNMMHVVLKKGLMLNVNSEIDEKLALELASCLNITIMLPEADKKENKINLKEQVKALENTDGNNLKERPPVVAILGHVDHGKTLLLDSIRQSNVADGEAGGITQHIGAYQIETEKGQKITFMDTPGHEAFTSIRARGAQVTDIAILVVAADDGVKPQTVEAISHAKAAGVPIIVAINKMDKPEANIEQCKQGLSAYELISEDWGGDTIFVEVSAKTKKGIPELLDMVLLVSEMQELKAPMTGFPKGVVIESQLSAKTGPMATVLVKAGQLKLGQFIAVGNAVGKVRALYDNNMQAVKLAEPGFPVLIMGLDRVPVPGDILQGFESEKVYKELLEDKLDNQEGYQRHNLGGVSLDGLSDQVSKGDVKQVELLIKADAGGSLEAIVGSIQKLTQENIHVRILHAAIGHVVESDLMLAKTSGASILAFNVEVPAMIKRLAQEEGISVERYQIIYQLLDDVERLLLGQKTIEKVEQEIGEVEVRELFSFSKIGAIAGSYVSKGKVLRESFVSVMRSGKEVHKGAISSLKRFKEDVKEVKEGFECGIVLEDFDKLEKGDVLVCKILVEKSPQKVK